MYFVLTIYVCTLYVRTTCAPCMYYVCTTYTMRFILELIWIIPNIIHIVFQLEKIRKILKVELLKNNMVSCSLGGSICIMCRISTHVNKAIFPEHKSQNDRGLYFHILFILRTFLGLFNVPNFTIFNLSRTTVDLQ